MSPALNLESPVVAAVESLVVAVIVLVFAWRAVRQLLPGLHRSLSSHARRLIGLRPLAVVSASASCGDGCGPCSGCGKTASTAGNTTPEQPITFAPRKHGVGRH